MRALAKHLRIVIVVVCAMLRDGVLPTLHCTFVRCVSMFARSVSYRGSLAILVCGFDCGRKSGC